MPMHSLDSFALGIKPLPNMGVHSMSVKLRYSKYVIFAVLEVLAAVLVVSEVLVVVALVPELLTALVAVSQALVAVEEGIVSLSLPEFS